MPPNLKTGIQTTSDLSFLNLKPNQSQGSTIHQLIQPPNTTTINQKHHRQHKSCPPSQSEAPEMDGGRLRARRDCKFRFFFSEGFSSPRYSLFLKLIALLQYHFHFLFSFVPFLTQSNGLWSFRFHLTVHMKEHCNYRVKRQDDEYRVRNMKARSKPTIFSWILLPRRPTFWYLFIYN